MGWDKGVFNLNNFSSSSFLLIYLLLLLLFFLVKADGMKNICVGLTADRA